MLLWIPVALAVTAVMLWSAAQAVAESMTLAQARQSMIPPRGSWAP